MELGEYSQQPKRRSIRLKEILSRSQQMYSQDGNVAADSQNKQVSDLISDCGPIDSLPIKIGQNVRLVGGGQSRIENRNTKLEARNSNESNDNDEQSGQGVDQYVMVLSIDQNDKKRFFSIRENALAMKSKRLATVDKSVNIETVKVKIPGNGRFINLEPSDVMELYTQDINSVAELKKNMVHLQKNQ